MTRGEGLRMTRGEELRGAPFSSCHRGKRMREAGMIRFAEMAIFLGVQQLFFIRTAITSGRFSC